ncbi:MAG: hypothetical protein Q9217_002943 [Psora testacea]
MAAGSTDEAVDGPSSQYSELQISDEYDPAQAQPAISAALSPTNAPAFTVQSDPSVDNIQINKYTPNIAPLIASNCPSAIALLNGSTERQSQSRSMSSASSSFSSSDQVIITGQSPESVPQNSSSTERNAATTSNAASLLTSTSPSTLPVDDKSLNGVSPDTHIQGGIVSNASANAVPDPVLPETGASIQNISNTSSSESLQASSTTDAVPPVQQQPNNGSSAMPKARLPHDKIGMLEDRVKDDPRGDLDAWLSLIEEHKKRGKLEDARSVYERFFVVFPFAAEIWVSYAQMENEAQNRHALDNVLGKSLMQVPYLPLWTLYLDHVRRHNNLTTDTSGTARQTINSAYELALKQVGLDKDSGRMWQDYILFVKSAPGIIGGSNWQDQQKMDLLRKAYQRAICIPTQATNTLWKEYDGFEMGLNKMTGRKFLQDQSPAYMSARSSYTELQNITRDLRRTTLPPLPPAVGFEGDVDYMEQLSTWKRWIQWEKDDPLVLKQDDIDAYRARILFVYKHALMAMRFWPELWCDASEFCFSNDLEEQGNDFLVQGIAANPESCLLAFKRADRLELSTANEEGDEKTSRRAAAVKEPYDKLLDALYDLITKSKTREEQDIARIEAQFAGTATDQQPNGVKEEEDEEHHASKEKQKAELIEAAKSMHAVQIRLLSRTVSYAWIALMRALRRIQGKGGVGQGGARGTFSDARKRGRITPDVYVQAALIEFHCYDPDTGRKIFERGLKLFQEDENFALEYIKHLVANNDHTNARVVFETVVTRLSQKPETVAKAKPLYAFFHDFESRYGELAQVVKLEKRMSDLFPEDSSLLLFSKRFVDDGFDPTAIRPIISPAKQTRHNPVHSKETTALIDQALPLQSVSSPKRPLPLDDSDNDADRPRKIVRGESPLKGAPSQRMVQQNSQQPPPPQFSRPPMPQPYLPPPLPRDVTFLLSIIPKAETYHATRFEPKELVRLIRETNIPTHISQLPPQPAGRGMSLPGPPPQQAQHMPLPHVQGPSTPYAQHGPPPPMQQRPGMPPMPQMPPMGYGQYNGQANALAAAKFGGLGYRIMTGAGKNAAGRGRGRGGGDASAPALQPAAYDGPSEARGRTPSQSRPESAAPASSAARTRSRSRLIRGYDADTGKAPSLLKNVDFGGEAYNMKSSLSFNLLGMSSSTTNTVPSGTDSTPAGASVNPVITAFTNNPLGANPFRDQMPTSLMQRGEVGFGKAGKTVKLNINSHEVLQWPNRDVYQYDVLIGSGAEKRGLVMAVWESSAVQNAVGQSFIFDGNKLGWSLKKFDHEIKLHVDLDAEKGVPPRKGNDGKPRDNNHRVRINLAKRVRLESLRAYLEGRLAFEVSVLESINFFDHLLRESPSKKLINFKRSYFSRVPQSHERTLVGGGIEAMKGVYQSIRAAEGRKLVVNVDVSNSCFWHEESYAHLAYLISGRADRDKFRSDAINVPFGSNEPPLYRFLRRLHRTKFYIKHRGRGESTKLHTLMRISSKTSDTYKFDYTDRETGKVENMSIAKYFQKKYNVRLQCPWLPVLETAKSGEVYPMELAYMAPGQRYLYKLNEDQTSKMIKFAVSRPAQRKQAIDHGLGMLQWQNDDYLKNYGMKISPTMLQTNARVLDPPEVLFAKGATAKPMYSGRWDLRGKVFFKPNETPLKAWGVCCLVGDQGGNQRGVPTKDQVQLFLQNFMKLYQGHGGRIENKNPPIMGGIPDTAKAIEATFMEAGNRVHMRPQMLIVIVTNRSTEVYNRVKKNCDCRWGVMSQVVQASNVLKNAPQYCSNVLMKFNCKLGGTTSAIKFKKPYFDVPTMILGADVSHPAPGSPQASMAALTMSMDTTCSRYAAGVQSNGHRVEMITAANFQSMMQPLLQHWLENVGQGRPPKHVYYLRDGVSESQYGPVLKNEVADIKQVFSQKTDGRVELMPKFTVVVAEKRHHIRFFPQQGPAADKNGNPVPGTIVDRDVTHPFENDVYLCSHAAIQGTARPTHYHMLMDEAKLPVDKFQMLLYEHCYQYQRATTPVSLFPAVYYAHLAASRAISHIDEPVTRTWAERHQLLQNPGVPVTNPETATLSEAPPLLEMEPRNKIALGMWYI